MSLTAVTREEHTHKRWLRRESFAFAAGDSVLPLVASEVAIAATSMPVAFIPQGDGYQLVAVMGLAPNQNLFVSTNDAWLMRYIPASYRVGAFRLAANDSGEMLLCVDEATGLISDGPEGEPFFDEDGKPTQSISDMLQMLSQLNESQQVGANICALLNKHGLIEPWDIAVEGPIGPQRVEGLYRVNEVALNALPVESFLELRQSGALALVYAHLLSTHNIKTLEILYTQRNAAQAQATPESDTFSFANLH
jgi:hypothetical protein